MARDPDSGRGRRRPPAPPPDDLERTEDELTPVENLALEVETLKTRVADQAAAIAERWGMPSTEAWARILTEIEKLGSKVAELDKEQRERKEREARWGRVLAWAKPIAGTLALTILTWAVAELGNAGARRRDAAALGATITKLVTEFELVRDRQIADHALLHQHLRGDP